MCEYPPTFFQMLVPPSSINQSNVLQQSQRFRTPETNTISTFPFGTIFCSNSRKQPIFSPSSKVSTSIDEVLFYTIVRRESPMYRSQILLFTENHFISFANSVNTPYPYYITSQLPSSFALNNNSSVNNNNSSNNNNNNNSGNYNNSSGNNSNSNNNNNNISSLPLSTLSPQTSLRHPSELVHISSSFASSIPRHTQSTFPTAIPLLSPSDISSQSHFITQYNEPNTNSVAENTRIRRISQQPTRFQLEQWNREIRIRDTEGQLIFTVHFSRQSSSVTSLQNRINFVYALTGEILAHVEYRKRSFGTLEFKLLIGEIHFATLKQKWALTVPKFKVEVRNRSLDGADLTISGNLRKREFTIFRGDRQEVAHISKYFHKAHNDISTLEILPGTF